MLPPMVDADSAVVTNTTVYAVMLALHVDADAHIPLVTSNTIIGVVPATAHSPLPPHINNF
jgi:hypothetical protein